MTLVSVSASSVLTHNTRARRTANLCLFTVSSAANFEKIFLTGINQICVSVDGCVTEVSERERIRRLGRESNLGPRATQIDLPYPSTREVTRIS